MTQNIPQDPNGPENGSDNFLAQSLPSVNGRVAIGYDKEGHITLWAYEEYGDEPDRLTPEQSKAVGQALIEAAERMQS